MLDEESALIESIQKLPLQEARYKDYTGFLLPLQTKVGARLQIPASKLEHVLVAEYRPGTALGWHRDVPAFELVCGISLGGACRMRFRPFPPRKNRKEVLSLELAPRSAYVLRDDARWRWQHSIPATKVLRYSITFRTLA